MIMTDLQKSQANKILSCYNNVEDIIEKGGPGSGRKRGDHVIYYNPITKRSYAGRIHSSDKDGKYHHVRTTSGGLEYLENKHIKEANDKEKESINKKMSEGTYADGETFDHDFKKSEDIDIEKGGEGSRGGKVIGHTRSGKPIYENKSAKEYKDFSKKDHADARVHHLANKNDKLADEHNEEYSKEEPKKEVSNSSARSSTGIGDALKDKKYKGKDTDPASGRTPNPGELDY